MRQICVLEASAALVWLVHMLLMDSTFEMDEVRLASLAAVNRLRSGIDLHTYHCFLAFLDTLV